MRLARAPLRSLAPTSDRVGPTSIRWSIAGSTASLGARQSGGSVRFSRTLQLGRSARPRLEYSGRVELNAGEGWIRALGFEPCNGVDTAPATSPRHPENVRDERVGAALSSRAF